MKTTLLDCATQAGRLLLEHFGKVRGIRVKDSRSSVVTEADLASEQLILEKIRARYPDHNIVAEETGWQDRGAAYTWVIDPLDGTSNFAAGIPWFGVMIAVLEHRQPILGAMYLPTEDLLYVAERGGGVTRNGQAVSVTAETELRNVLCAYGMDAMPDERHAGWQTVALGRLVQQARNLRATNSLVDFLLTIDGRLGAAVNFHAKIWDIAAPCLLFAEAGARVTDLRGQPINLELGADGCQRSYGLLAANPTLHAQVLEILLSAAPPTV